MTGATQLGVMSLDRSSLDGPAARYSGDPDLYAELRRRYANTTASDLEGAARSFGVRSEELATSEGLVTPIGRRVAESIVKATARPVLIIRDNSFTARFIGPNSIVWAQRVVDAGPLLDRAIPSVGRIELKNNPDFQWVGTGWVVAEDIVVTNRHVAQEFARAGERGFTFRLGLNGSPQSVRVDFLEEYERRGSRELAIESVLYIGRPDGPDVAFLRLARTGSNLPFLRPIPLATRVSPDEVVAAIGYPARDPRVPDQELVRKVFGDVYDKKRLAPGQIMAVRETELEHDCSTLGGNSGSVLVSLNSGDAVGLHYSGIFLEANYAVPAPLINDLLVRVQSGELPAATPVVVTPPPSIPVQAGGGDCTFRFNIPIEITVRVGTPALIPPVGGSSGGGGGRSDGGAGGGDKGDPLESAVAAAREALAHTPDILEIRPGYRFKNGRITDERVVVVEVREKRSLVALRDAAVAPIPNQFLGVGVDVRTAAIWDQLAAMGVDLNGLEAPAKGGLYREPPQLTLEPVREKMQAVFHLSPDSGFPNLKAFLGRVKRRLTATIYEWESEDVSDAVAQAMKGNGASLTMVTQAKHGIAQGTETAVRDMQDRIGNKFRHVFASVGAGKLIPSAYHIKVASRDGEEFWLSSGNWKESNQPAIDPAGENSTALKPLRTYNREWHAIIANPKLALMFQKYIEWDFAEAKRVPYDEGLVVPALEFFVPEEAFLAREAPTAVRYFDPLVLDRELDVTPLLTPDRDGHHRHIFIHAAADLVESATERVYVENQSFSISTENDEYERFFTALKDKQEAGLDVKIIFRDPRQYPNGAHTLQKTLEKIKAFGFDTDMVKWQRNCHTKGLIVDGKAVMLGSQNLTGAGALFNRDASLLVRDRKVAEYFEEAFLFDWERLAVQEAEELVGGMRPAAAGEATPRGFRRVSLAELIGVD